MAVASVAASVQFAHAQNSIVKTTETDAVSAQKPFPEELPLEEVLVTASALRTPVGEAVQPATVMRGDILEQNLATDIGTVLEKTPGLSNAGFGPGVGQPVIRGLGAGRVRTLQDGTDTFDAANVSADHAISSDPLSAEAIEVLRGPATLVYGSGAIGGVVNTVDSLISEKPHEETAGQIAFGVDNGKQGKFARGGIELGDGTWAVHLHGSKTESDDIEIPGYAEASPEEGEEKTSSLDNSAVETENVSLGVAYHQSWGFVGIGVERVESLYGIPGGHGHHEEEEGEEHEEAHHEDEEDVRIDLKQDRVRLKGEWFEPVAGLESLRFKASLADYEHQELEGDEVGTRFSVKGKSVRIEAVHSPLGYAKGVVGVHLKQRDFEAAGEEAFVPNTKTDSQALYLVEKLELSDRLTVEAGLRLEQEKHHADGFTENDFDLFGASLGMRYELLDELAFTGSFAHGERAASAEELYSNGVHVATNSFERGDENLDKEKSFNTDIGLRWESAAFSASINAFYNQFSQFIYKSTQDCNNDGVADRVEAGYSGVGCDIVDHDEDPLLLNNTQGKTDFHGFEVALSYRLIDTEQEGLSLNLFGDSVRGRLDDGGDLPRIPGQRVGVSVDYQNRSMQTGLSWLRVLEQDDVAALETPTDGYKKVDAYVTWWPMGADTGWKLMLRGENLLNEEIRNHASFLKDTVPAIGRHFILATEFVY